VQTGSRLGPSKFLLVHRSVIGHRMGQAGTVLLTLSGRQSWLCCRFVRGSLSAFFANFVIHGPLFSVR
jgi:hypothetical protein